MTPALFLDRDGVINADHGYVHRPADFEFLPGIFDLCRVAADCGHPVFVVTNQAGIGRGLYTEDDFHALTRWMCAQFEAAGAPVRQVYFCPTHPHAGIGRYRVESPLRKPAPGMILQARDDFSIDLPRSALVGDKASDVAAGRAAGVGLNLLLRGAGGNKDSADMPGAPAHGDVVHTLADAAARVRAHWAGLGLGHEAAG